ncbi:hypothetical protein ACRAWC_08780 [Leifsonia sp. L25]|uniref:hypothetical protein n=1 Tax=Actinomycetes TaxID=1760 RepID=UPI003D6990C0
MEKKLVLNNPARFPVTLRIADIEACALLLAALEDYAATCETDALEEFAPTVGSALSENALASRLHRSAGLARRILDDIEDAEPARGDLP